MKNILNRRVSASYARISRWAIAYAVLPITIFLLTWVKIPIGLPCLALLAYFAVFCPYGRLSHSQKETVKFAFNRPVDGLKSGDIDALDNAIPIRLWVLVVLAIGTIVWCVLGGQGSLWAQTDDWYIRNAIFRDLITHSWPVYYNDGEAAMAYYIAHWLPPASIGHLLFMAGVSIDTVWPIANLLLLAWTATGMVLVELLAIITIGVRSSKQALMTFLMLVFFSTPDIIGIIGTNRWGNVLPALHLEWWASTSVSKVAQYSSITTCLFWVFNQSVIPWICTLCFLNERSVSNYVLIWTSCFFAGPFPSIGLAILMLAQGLGLIAFCARSRMSIRPLLLSLASKQSFSMLPTAIIVALFFITNTGSTRPAYSSMAPSLMPYPIWIPENPKGIVMMALFILVEGVLVTALVAKGNTRKPVFVGMAFTLVLCPLVRMGGGLDFGMRVSIPSILLLYVFCCRFIFACFDNKKDNASNALRYRAVALALVLALGAITPAVEFYRGFHEVIERGIEASQPDRGSLEGADFSHANAGTDAPQDTLFFSLIAS